MKTLTNLITVLLFTVCVPSFSQDYGSLIENYIHTYEKLHRFSGSILVMKDDKVLISKGFGSANIELQVNNSPQTKFRLGSITKQFTALAILQLEERGLINTNDPISKFIPDYPKGNNITILNLLTHTSGIPGFTSFPEFEESKMLQASPIQIIDRFKNIPLIFQPGTKFKYSDSGYIILGYILEKVTGKLYQEYLNENIFEPLNMYNTGYDNPNIILQNRASGYVYKDGILCNADYINMSQPFSAGAMYSTTEDLYKWDRALYSNTLLKSSSLKEMFTKYKENYGYGWYIDDYNSHKKIWHNGLIDGFSAVITRLPDDNICIVVLSNFIDTPILQINNDIMAILFGKPYRNPENLKTINIDEQIINDYLGSYEINSDLRIDIKLTNNHLFIQPTGQGKFEIFSKEKDKFFTIDFDSEITFERDIKKKVNGLVLHQNNSDIKAKKVF